jgi:hypothetical protein
MAGRKKKKVAKRSTKRKAKARKTRRVAKKSTRRAAARKAPARKMKAAKRPARKKKSARGEYGEGNYKATKRFRKSEEAFVERNRRDIPAMGREAEAALEGPEGPSLIEAENEARSRAAE